MAKAQQSIVHYRHPYHAEKLPFWQKWRCAYEAGDEFRRLYLKKLSVREDDTDFQDRMAMSPIPSFASAAIDDITNAIFQRINDVVRQGGPESYQRAVTGRDGGVDYKSNAMGSFIAESIVTELLVQEKVGVLVDNHYELGRTLAEKEGKHPFLTA